MHVYAEAHYTIHTPGTVYFIKQIPVQGKVPSLPKRNVIPLRKQTGNFIMCIIIMFIYTVKRKRIKNMGV